MLERLDKKIILAIAIIIVIFIFWSGGKYNGWKNAQEDIQIEEDLAEEDLEADEEEENEAASTLIMVHVFGAVQKPGLYELIEGSRIEDALKLAQPRPEALIDKYLNRAKILEDEEAIFVPTAEDIENSENLDAIPVITGGFNPLDQEGGPSGGQININKASSTELQTLPGIGAVKAEAIVQYREDQGKFKAIEDITNVTGIGAATLENIKDQISVR